MFDSNLCARQFTQFPLFFNWGQFNWLKIPLLLILILVVLSGVRWIIQHPRWKRWLSSSRGILFLTSFTALLLLILAVADRGLVIFLPPDPGTAVEAIVVLGRGTEFGKLRVNVAAELWQAKRAPAIFVSGVGDTPRMISQLKEKGIPDRAIDGEACSLTTPENAIFSAAVLQSQGINRILLITDPPHRWRSLLEFRAQGFTVIPHTSPLPNRMSFVDKTFLVFREYLFLTTSSLKRLFNLQQSPEANDPELLNLVQKAEQYGKQHSFR